MPPRGRRGGTPHPAEGPSTAHTRLPVAAGAAAAGEDGAADGRDARGLVLGGLPDAPEAAGLIRGEATLSLIEDEVVGRRSVSGETGEVRRGGAERSSGAEQRPPAERAVCAVPVADGVLTHAEDDSPGVHPLEEDGARVAAVEQHGGELSAVSPVASGWVICRGVYRLSAAAPSASSAQRRAPRTTHPSRSSAVTARVGSIHYWTTPRSQSRPRGSSSASTATSAAAGSCASAARLRCTPPSLPAARGTHGRALRGITCR